MTKKLFYYIICLLLFSTGIYICSNTNILLSSEEKKEVKSSVYADSIVNIITQYLKGKIIGPEPDRIYTPVYFFDKDSIHYFTIFRMYHSYIEVFEFNNPDLIFNYYSGKINNQWVIYISETNYDISEFLIGNMQKTNLYDLTFHEMTIIYDGSYFPETYRYKIEDESIIIEQLSEPIIDILGKDYIKYEKAIKEREAYKQSIYSQ